MISLFCLHHLYLHDTSCFIAGPGTAGFLVWPPFHHRPMNMLIIRLGYSISAPLFLFFLSCFVFRFYAVMLKYRLLIRPFGENASIFSIYLSSSGVAQVSLVGLCRNDIRLLHARYMPITRLHYRIYGTAVIIGLCTLLSSVRLYIISVAYYTLWWASVYRSVYCIPALSVVLSCAPRQQSSNSPDTMWGSRSKLS